MSRSPTEDNVFNSFTTSLSQAAGNLSRQIGRTAASAHELLSDADLRRKGTSLIVQEASKGIRDIQQKVGHAAGTLTRSFQQGIISGPRQIQVSYHFLTVFCKSHIRQHLSVLEQESMKRN